MEQQQTKQKQQQLEDTILMLINTTVEEAVKHQNQEPIPKGSWCGYKSLWSRGNSRIVYDKLLLHSSTNINKQGTVLDINSGKICMNSYSTCHFKLNMLNILGIFVVPLTGVYRVSLSLASELAGYIHGQTNEVWIYKNGGRIEESKHTTYSKYYTA